VAAIELIHLASLVHDDIIDDGDMRRNEKTAHKQWRQSRSRAAGRLYPAEINGNGLGDDKMPGTALSLSKASSRLIMAEVMEVDQTPQCTNLSCTQYFCGD
jgi:geranylgeranyl pyrophosphate synthase